MAWRGHHVMLLVVLLSMWLALASEETRYEKFLRQHVNFPKTIAKDDRDYCNLMMLRRGMTLPTWCKFNNTFIHATNASIIKICGAGGTPAGGNLRNSNANFSLTTCRKEVESNPPCCDYRGYPSNQSIRIGCDGGKPVHFDGVI